MLKMTEYRADVDGLRGIAVLLVLLFHVGLQPLGGGFIGVDVFFVISGYLITNIIYKDIFNNTFSFSKFYERRARRILPALITVVLTTCVGGYYLLYPEAYRVLGQSAVAALLAISNWFFLHNTAYFDAPAQTQALLHTWSLGVEEQFYLVWPALLLTASKFCGKSRRAWIALLAVIALASFAGSLWKVAYNPKVAFYMPYTRAWELAIGGLLCFLRPLRSRAMQVFPPLGLAAIGWSATTLSGEQPFPGFNALAPTIGAALVIYPRHTQAGRLLGWLAPLGRISYSLYLWHWPIIVFWRTYNNGEPVGLNAACLIIAASIGLSVLSWRYIEQPARRIRIRGALPIALSGNVAAMAAVLPIVLADGLPSRVPEAARRSRTCNRPGHGNAQRCSISDCPRTHRSRRLPDLYRWGSLEVRPPPCGDLGRQHCRGDAAIIRCHCPPARHVYRFGPSPARQSFTRESCNDICRRIPYTMIFVRRPDPLCSSCCTTARRSIW